MNETVHFILTGGTIDSRYDGYFDTVVPRDHSILPAYVDGLKLDASVVFTEVCMKDSRTMSDEFRSQVVEVIANAPESRFVVTHGLYTMGDTAAYLKSHLAKSEKSIALVGSLVPIDGFALSDGGFNLGYAFAQICTLAPGVYVCANGVTLSQ